MEEGSHEQLLGIKDGVYANLINMQAGREGEEDITVSAVVDLQSTDEGEQIPGLLKLFFANICFTVKIFKYHHQKFNCSSCYARLSALTVAD